MVLASRSASRAAILRAAGVAFEVESSGVDEAALKVELLARGDGPLRLAEQLAEAKARKVSERRPDALVLGADQTLDLDGELIDKAESLDEARARLEALKGRAHQLHSAVVATIGGRTVWAWVESPRLLVRDFSATFLDGYLARGGSALLSSVGCYFLEGEGALLFERVEGDYFAVLGLPLLPVLELLRREGALAA